jgi:menaquinone-dependent protoporphyrinogen oxidase
MGNIYRPIRGFIDKNIDVLLSKKTAFYMCNAYPAILQKAIIKNIPEKLINAAICIKSLGGKLPFRSTNNQDWILTDNMDYLLQSIKTNAHT